MKQEKDPAVLRHHVFIEKDNRMNGCLGIVLEIFVVILILRIGIFLIGVFLPDEKEPIPLQYFHVKSEQGEASIHTGMSKDSVIILLGQPTEYDYNKLYDEIIYRYGEYGMNYTEIKFENGEVSSVRIRESSTEKRIKEFINDFKEQ